MSVSAKAFQQWLHSVAPGSSMAEICRLSAIKRSTVAQQMVRGKVSVSTVVSVSRGYKVDVVQALAGFEPYKDLATGVKPPTQAELVSQISDVDLLRQIIARNVAGDSAGPAPVQELLPMPHRTSVRSWIDAIDASDLRQRISRELGIAPQNFSAQLSANRLTPDAAIQAARIAGVGLTGGLAASGLLTPVEAGWAEGAREEALRTLSDTDLVFLAASRLDALGKTLRRVDQDNEQSNALWENLG